MYIFSSITTKLRKLSIVSSIKDILLKINKQIILAKSFKDYTNIFNILYRVSGVY